jgi:hypothetical protein
MSNFSRAIIILALAVAARLPLSAQSPLTQLLQGSSAASPPAKTSDQLGRDTPYGTVYGFLQAAQGGDYSIAAQYLQMSAAHRQSEGDALAMKLYVAMNDAFAGNLRPSRQPEGTLQEDVPTGRQRLGTMSAGDVEDELELVRVNDPGAGKIWLISSDTLARIPELYEQVEGRQVETKLPRWMVRHQWGGMPLWQWLALLVLIPVASAAAWLLLVVLQVPLRWWTRRTGALALSFRSGMASRGRAHSPDSGQLSGHRSAAPALLQSGRRGRGDYRRILDFVARDSLVPAAYAQPRFGARPLGHRLADVTGRTHHQSGRVRDGTFSCVKRAGLQHEHGAGGRGHWNSGGWFRSAADHCESIWRRFGSRR